MMIYCICFHDLHVFIKPNCVVYQVLSAFLRFHELSGHSCDSNAGGWRGSYMNPSTQYTLLCPTYAAHKYKMKTRTKHVFFTTLKFKEKPYLKVAVGNSVACCLFRFYEQPTKAPIIAQF